MNITKIGHCCLLIEENGKRILTDPGAWTTEQNNVTGVDIIVITHEHPDHFHLESLKQVLANNPTATIVTNSAVSKLLEAAGIASVIVENGQKQNIESIELAGFGDTHAIIHPRVPNVQNTGYMIAGRFFYPGDAFTTPNLPIEILAMPMIGPWMTLAQAIDWAIDIKPSVCIPVHDGMLSPRQWIYKNPERILDEEGIRFDAIEPDESREY